MELEVYGIHITVKRKLSFHSALAFVRTGSQRVPLLALVLVTGRDTRIHLAKKFELSLMTKLGGTRSTRSALGMPEVYFRWTLLSVRRSSCTWVD